MGRMSLFSAPGSVLIKTTLLKSLQRRCSQHTDLALIKTSTDNSRWQTARCSDNQISRSLYTSGKAYGNLVLLATLPGAKKPRCVGKCGSIYFSFPFTLSTNNYERRVNRVKKMLDIKKLFFFLFFFAYMQWSCMCSVCGKCLVACPH